MALGQPSPGTEKVVFSTQLLLCGATGTHYTITHTNKDNMPKSPSLTLTWVSADQRSRVHTHTHIHTCTYIHTHTKTHHVHPQVILPAQPCVCRGETWRLDGECPQLHRPLCFPERAPSPQPSTGQGQGLLAKGTLAQQAS